MSKRRELYRIRKKDELPVFAPAFQNTPVSNYGW